MNLINDLSAKTSDTIVSYGERLSSLIVSNVIKDAKLDMIRPPIVPAASGNQKASLSVPSMNGINPSMVDITVRKIGVILAFHAFR